MGLAQAAIAAEVAAAAAKEVVVLPVPVMLTEMVRLALLLKFWSYVGNQIYQMNKKKLIESFSLSRVDGLKNLHAMTLRPL